MLSHKSLLKKGNIIQKLDETRYIYIYILFIFSFKNFGTSIVNTT